MLAALIWEVGYFGPEAYPGACQAEPHGCYKIRAGKVIIELSIPFALGCLIERSVNDMSADRQNIEVEEKEVPQQLEYRQDGGKVSMAAPIDQAERRLVWKVSSQVYSYLLV